MRRESHGWHSDRLGRHMGVVVYGHWGPPMIAFPTSGGDEWEYERQGLIGAIGRARSTPAASRCSASTPTTATRSATTARIRSTAAGCSGQYDEYIRPRGDALHPQPLPVGRRAGCGRWARRSARYHAANTLFKHPDVVKRCFALSGVYDMKRLHGRRLRRQLLLQQPGRLHRERVRPAGRCGHLASCDIHIATGIRPVGAAARSPTACRACSRAAASVTTSTTGARSAGTTGRTGSIRCGSIYSECELVLEIQPRTSRRKPNVHQIPALADHLRVVDPDVAVARQDVDVRARFPVGAGLAAVGVAEREVDARDLLVLQQDADHLAEREVGAERQLADAVAVLVGVAVVPELALEILALAVRATQPPAGDLERQRRRAQIAVLRSEVVAGGAVADEDAVDRAPAS